MPVVKRRGDVSPAKYDSLTRSQIIRNLRRNLPKEVIKLNSFVVFKFAPPKKPGGKRGKLPYYVVNRKIRSSDHGSKDDVQHLVSFAEAMRLFETNDRFAGLGVCALQSNDVFFIDIDNCVDVDTGEINDAASELLTWNTYTELSPSGKGLRLIMTGNPQINNKHKGIEIFSNKGFVTLTGIPFGSAVKPVRRITKQQLARLYALLESEPDQTDEDIRNIPSPLDKERYRDVRKAIKHIDPDCSYDEWLLVGQALHSGDSDPAGKGFRLWLSWSQKGQKFEETSEEEMAKKWSSFNSGRGITLSSLFRLAQTSGYKGRTDDPVPDNEIHPGKKSSRIQETETYPLAERLFDNIGAYLFIGRAKVGKSRILGALVAGALTGSSALGFKFNKKCRVLTLVLEEDPSVLLNRIRMYGVEPTEFDDNLVIYDEEVVAKSAAKLSEEYTWHAWLDKVIALNKPDFCYIDTAIKLKLLWQNDPEYQSKDITARDYQNAALIEQLAQKHKCVIVNVMHASKRKANPNHISDPFDSIGTTSWALAGCTGALVVGDRAAYNPEEEQDDGARVFSVRGRYMQTGDKRYLLQTNPSGTFENVGEYIQAQATVKQHEYLQIAWEYFNEGMEFVPARLIAHDAGRRERTVKMLLEKFMEKDGIYEEHRLEGVRGRGYTFIPLDKKRRGKDDDIDELLN